jgi:hypothetical protein
MDRSICEGSPVNLTQLVDTLSSAFQHDPALSLPRRQRSQRTDPNAIRRSTPLRCALARERRSADRADEAAQALSRNEALTPKQFPQQPQRRGLVALGLDQDFENLAFAVDCPVCLLTSQSAANPSANANSLLAGNLQGIFANLNQIRRKVCG